MKKKYLEKDEYHLWDDFVKQSLQGSIFSYTWYLNALAVKYTILCVFDKNESIFAGIILAKNHINTYSNPMLDKYLGVLFKQEETLSQKIISRQYKAMELLAKELKRYQSFDYYFHPEFKNWIPFYWNGFAQQTRYTYQINLTQEIDELHKKFHGNLKNDIKNAIKLGVSIKRDIEFEGVYSIVEKTFRRQGSKAPFDKLKLKDFISKLNSEKSLVSFGAFDSNDFLISVCGLVFDEKASYLLLNGIDINKQIRGANALMIFEAIKFIKKKNIPKFDFEGSMLPGVEQFYRRFGGDLMPYFQIWNDNFFNYFKTKAKKTYKRFRYGR